MSYTNASVQSATQSAPALTAVQAVAIVANVVDAAQYRAYCLGGQLHLDDWIACLEFAWYAGLDPSEALATLRRGYPALPASRFTLTSLEDMRATMTEWDEVEGFSLDGLSNDGCHRSDFEEQLEQVKAALAAL
jgi:hypothetical protein